MRRGGHCGEVKVRVGIPTCPQGQKKVAIVERWPLVEVRSDCILITGLHTICIVLVERIYMFKNLLPTEDNFPLVIT